MHLLNLLKLILAAAFCEAVHWQKLTCPYDRRLEGQPRVWCRQNSDECCSGLTFSHRARSVDGGKLEVTQGSDSFTVAALEPREGGVHWCGVLSKNNTVIKLAEGYFHSSSGAYIWSFTRWVLLPLLPIVTIFITIYSRATTKHISEEAEELYDDVTESGALASPQYENAAAAFELQQ
ncbi:uncharacterized protein [Pempheris klunzingeri]|uniref:uncharacterized protein n=1 Tax=Pempheris klunzingeri TaxID=3127111 RepID=UPI00397F9B85